MYEIKLRSESSICVDSMLYENCTKFQLKVSTYFEMYESCMEFQLEVNAYFEKYEN